MDFREYIAQFGVFLLCCLEVIVAESESISRFKGGSRCLFMWLFLDVEKVAVPYLFIFEDAAHWHAVILLCGGKHYSYFNFKFEKRQKKQS